MPWLIELVNVNFKRPIYCKLADILRHPIVHAVAGGGPLLTFLLADSYGKLSNTTIYSQGTFRLKIKHLLF